MPYEKNAVKKDIKKSGTGSQEPVFCMYTVIKNDMGEL